MKNVLVSIMLLGIMQPAEQGKQQKEEKQAPLSENIFIITIDGFRWQEFYNGADSLLINNEKLTSEPASIKALFWAATPEERRTKLLPFVWNVIARQGQLYGNRSYENKVDVANAYSISYPGYNEILTGTTDPLISSNQKYYNPNINILEYLEAKEGFKGRVAAFTSWDVFPYILNTKRNEVLLNSGYRKSEITENREEELINKVQEMVEEKEATRYDQLTFMYAKEYLKKSRPRVLYLGLGETDESAHDGHYDLYLQQANAADRMIAELWHWVQTTPGYKNNTTFIITTDHGRGTKTNKWSSHGSLIRGSSQVWLAVLGPGMEPLGEVKVNQQFYQKQVAATIAKILGEEFDPGQPVGEALALPLHKKAPAVDPGPASFLIVAGK
jgi:hypothetical protein